GPAGAVGPKGDNGDVGPVGPAGGEQGPQGEPGPIGPQGNPGNPGPTGQTGPAGNPGPGYSTVTDLGLVAGGRQFRLNPINGATNINLIAPIGPQGNPGLTGPQGLQGVTGARGLTGATGLRGLTGLTGATGPQGPAGETLPESTTGVALPIVGPHWAAHTMDPPLMFKTGQMVMVVGRATRSNAVNAGTIAVLPFGWRPKRTCWFSVPGTFDVNRATFTIQVAPNGGIYAQHPIGDRPIPWISLAFCFAAA
ncbi:MAG: hypothetical protein ACRCU2_17930, partial [Planktothrix sp.]